VTPSSPQSAPFPNLRLPRDEAEERIASRTDACRELLGELDDTGLSETQAERRYRQCNAQNEIMLRGLFEPADEMLEQYARATWRPTHLTSTARGAPPPPGLRKREMTQAIEGGIDALGLIRDALQYCPQQQVTPQASPLEREVSTRGDIFIVHGHDAGAKESVARFIEKLDLRAVILHEQPSGGRTVVEKLEEESSSVAYAVVLLTPDDIGAPGDKPEETKRRARQNVIFELGFFVGKLGRAKVCVLHKGVVDIPSDFQGVIYVQMDEAGAWQTSLAREMKEAGIDVRPNKVL
jgi:predicted nucleotide-binding protein